MATSTKNVAEEIEYDGLTTIAPEKKPERKVPMVEITIPALEEAEGMKVDQYEHVTIANEMGEKCYKVLRGERVKVPVEVFVLLKARYPKL